MSAPAVPSLRLRLLGCLGWKAEIPSESSWVLGGPWIAEAAGLLGDLHLLSRLLSIMLLRAKWFFQNVVYLLSLHHLVPTPITFTLILLQRQSCLRRKKKRMMDIDPGS